MVQKDAGISLLCVGNFLQEGGCTWRFRSLHKYHSSACRLLVAGRRRMYLLVQKGVGIKIQ